MERVSVHKAKPAPSASGSAPSWFAATQRSGVLQRRSEGQNQPGSVPPIVHDVLRSPGQPLDAATRAYMEPRFGHDFSKVRVHADGQAAEAASSINARAFTSGRNIAFGAGEYVPQTEAGRRLVSHELTHVVQQWAGVHLRDGIGLAGDAYERQADSAADAVAQGKSADSVLGRLDHDRSRGKQPSLELRGPLQKQDDPRKKQLAKDSRLSLGPQPVTFPELDDNPARGQTQRAKMLAEQFTAVKKAQAERIPDPAKDGWGKFFKSFLAAVDRLDRSMTGDARQGGLAFQIWGSGSGLGSTAAKPAKDVRFIGEVDFEELSEMMEIAVLSVSKPREMFTSWEDLKEEPVKVIFEWKQKLDEIKKVREEEERRERQKGGGDSSSVDHAELLQKVRELKKLVQNASDQSTADKPPAVEKTSTTKQNVAGQNEASGNTKAQGGKSPSPTTRAFDLLSDFAIQEWVSGDLTKPGGQISIYTDKRGTKRKIHLWVDKAGYVQYRILETIPAGVPKMLPRKLSSQEL